MNHTCHDLDPNNNLSSILSPCPNQPSIVMFQNGLNGTPLKILKDLVNGRTYHLELGLTRKSCLTLAFQTPDINI